MSCVENSNDTHVCYGTAAVKSQGRSSIVSRTKVKDVFRPADFWRIVYTNATVIMRCHYHLSTVTPCCQTINIWLLEGWVISSTGWNRTTIIKGIMKIKCDVLSTEVIVKRFWMIMTIDLKQNGTLLVTQCITQRSQAKYGWWGGVRLQR